MTNTERNENPIRLSDAESILAYIPHALGFHPEDSLVLLMVSDDKVEATMRIDLCHDQSDMRNWAYQVSSTTRRLGLITNVIPVIYIPAGDSASSAHYLEIIGTLAEALESYAVDMTSALGVDDKVFSYAESAYLDVDLNSVKFHPVNALLISVGSAPQPGKWDATEVPRWKNVDRVRALVEEAEYTMPEHFDAWIEALAQEDIGTPLEDESLCVKLLHGLKYKIVRDMLPVLAGCGATAMAKTLADVRAGHNNELSDYLLGMASIKPDWERIDRLDHLARFLLGGAVGDERYALMTIIVWIEWARGRSSMAKTLVEQVISEDSSYSLATLLKQLLQSGLIPSWATDPQRAWRVGSHL